MHNNKWKKAWLNEDKIKNEWNARWLGVFFGDRNWHIVIAGDDKKYDEHLAEAKRRASDTMEPYQPQIDAAKEKLEALRKKASESLENYQPQIDAAKAKLLARGRLREPYTSLGRRPGDPQELRGSIVQESSNALQENAPRAAREAKQKVEA